MHALKTAQTTVKDWIFFIKREGGIYGWGRAEVVTVLWLQVFLN